jgi:membrane protease YdiL (CAAX protease family)
MVFVLLAAALVAVGYVVWTDPAEYAAFKALTDTRDRQARYRIWVAKAFAIFIGLPVLGLVLLGRLEALWHFPAEFAAAVRVLPALDLEGDGLRPGLILGGLLAGGVLGGLVAARKGKGAKGPVLGDIEPLLPRNGAEIAHGALLGINAGLVEEIFFRLYLPLLLILAGFDAVAAFVIAGVIFGLVHLYQGWVGVLATTALGAVLSGAYLLSGSLAVPILLHILIDLNALVVRPLVTRLATRRGD